MTPSGRTVAIIILNVVVLFQLNCQTNEELKRAESYPIMGGQVFKLLVHCTCLMYDVAYN